jgi:hypothetical protein
MVLAALETMTGLLFLDVGDSVFLFSLGGIEPFRFPTKLTSCSYSNWFCKFFFWARQILWLLPLLMLNKLNEEERSIGETETKKETEQW